MILWWIDQRKFYGCIAGNARFRESYDRYLRLICGEGTEAAIRAYLSDVEEAL
jgi:hypothetical protein